MGILRRALLAGSRNVWLRERAVRYPFVRRSVSRFMPGETLADALDAARRIETRGAGTILTHLGENVTDAAEADAVARHYLQVMDEVSAAGLDTQVSIKLTQLGLDLDAERCFANLMTLLERAGARGSFLWIDMEGSGYVDGTLALYRRARAASPHVGVCLQSYLRRTPADLDALLPIHPTIRLVKGAYLEPPEIAFPRKRDVDEAYDTLATRLLVEAKRGEAGRLGIGTHDPRLVERLESYIGENAVPDTAYEFEMLYGIQAGLQQRLVAAGRRLRVLISYGDYWFPWYMRRLAERPANVLFVMRNVFAR